MNPTKRNKYVLTGSYHTLEVKSPGIDPGKETSISNYVNSQYLSKDGAIKTTIINPNKIKGDIFSFSDFKEAFTDILKQCNIKDCRITRADMRFDNYDREHYQMFMKLNKYLISALAVTYKIKNDYMTFGLFNGKPLSIAIKNDYFECESYDRQHKNEITNNTTEIAQARLEERTTHREWRKLNADIVFAEPSYNFDLLRKEFTTGWEERWEKAKNNLKLVQDTYNNELVEVYESEKNTHSIQSKSLTCFLLANQNSIFTKVQMVDLLQRLGVLNAEEKAKYYKKKYDIEYFSKKDVEYAINEIKRATNEYFSN